MFLYIIIIGFGFIIASLIILLTIYSNKATKQNKQNRFNEEALKKINEMNFNIDKKIVFCDYATYNKEENFKQFFAIDNQNEKIAFIDYKNGNVYIVNFNEILNYEIYENNNLQTSGIGVGGLIGIAEASTTGNCKDLRLIIRLKSISCPQVCYDIVDSSFGIYKSSDIYRECIRSLQEATSTLEVILNKNKSEK